MCDDEIRRIEPAGQPGMDRVRVTCDRDHLASAGVIRNNGGA